MDKPLNLLVLKDSPEDTALIVQQLAQAGFTVNWQRVASEADFLARLEPAPDLIISDYSLPAFTGVRAVELVRRRGLDVPFILVSGTAGEDRAVEAMKRGATDYLLKDHLARLGSVVANALTERRRHGETRQMREQLAAQQAALQDSEARLAGIINSATDGIITTDQAQRIIIFNPAAEQMFGHRAADLLGQPLDRLIPSRFQHAHTGHVRKFGATGISSRRMGALGTIFGLRADGTEFPIEASISQVEAGGQKLFTVILRDITARKMGEEARNRLAAIVESSEDAIISESLDGVIVSWNAGAENLFGYPAAEMIGRTIAVLVPPELGTEAAEVLAAINRGERVSQLETVRLRKGGARINISLTVSPIRDAGGKIVGAARIARDITARKRLEAAVAAAAEEERGRIARDLHDGLAQQLGGALFLSDLVHRDLKARQAAESARAGQVHALVVEALHQARELARGLYPVPPEPEGLMTALQNLADRVSRDRQLDCSFDTNSSVLLPDQTIATHLYRIAQEAVNNALKHGAARRIAITLHLTTEMLELRVRDHGTGLPATLPAGLGMQTMQQRARLIAAQLSVHNAAGGGVEVVCSLKRIWSTPARSA